MKRMLLIEDDANIKEMLEMYLEMKGYQVELASEGKEGLEKVRASLANGTPYDILVTDVDMPPGMNGIQMVTHLIQDSEFSTFNTPIIVMSGYFENQKKVHDLCPNLTFLEKPVQPLDKLVQTMENLITNKRNCKGAA